MPARAPSPPRFAFRAAVCLIVAVATILTAAPAQAAQRLPGGAPIESDPAIRSSVAAAPGLRPLVGPRIPPRGARPEASVASAAASGTAGKHLLVKIPQALPVTARPWGGRVVGTMPSGSRFYDVPLVAWVMEVSPNGRFGRVPIPYRAEGGTGWIDLRGLRRTTIAVTVRADISDHEIVVERAGRVVARFAAATGAPSSPTPPGRYFVTDRIPFPRGSVLGSFAFGISGIQPRLPAGWNGGDQLAIHGTNAPRTIGTSASAGCLRVSEFALARLKPLLRLGTPVIVTP